jgi:hypothetical protein
MQVTERIQHKNNLVNEITSKGDGLTGHELLQNAWLEANGYGPRGSEWSKLNRAIALKENLSVSISFLQRKINFQKCLNLCYELADIIEAAYGEIVNCSFPKWCEPIDLNLRTPELHWGHTW